MSGLANLFRRFRPRRDWTRDDIAAGESAVAIDLRIPDMVCEGCAEKVGAALQSVPGVRDIQSNVSQKRIRVQYEPAAVDPRRLKDAVSRAGFLVLEANG